MPSRNESPTRRPRLPSGVTVGAATVRFAVGALGRVNASKHLVGFSQEAPTPDGGLGSTF